MYIRVNTGPWQFTTVYDMTHKGIPLLLLLLGCTPYYCNGNSIPIVDAETAFPFLRSVDNPSSAMWWDSGTIIQLMSSCKLIRVTRRGVRCIPANSNLIGDWERMFPSHVPPNTKVSCVPVNSALCMTSNGSRFFPTDTVFVSEGSVSNCLNGQRRQLVPGEQTQAANKTSNYGKDDISLCDIMDNNLDVIYDPVNNYIHTKELSKAAGLYTFMSVLILVVVVLTAEAVSQRARSHLTHNIVAWVLLTGTALLMLVHTDGRMHPFVTIEDRTFLLVSLVYIMASTTYWAYTVSVMVSTIQDAPKKAAEAPKLSAGAPTKSTGTPTKSTGEPTKSTGAPTKSTGALDVHSDEPPSAENAPETQRDGVNAMIGSIHFATCVLYGTPDNAYVAGFFFIFLFRCMQKMYDAHHRPGQWTLCANTMLILDVTYTATIFVFGVLPHFTNDSDTILYAAAQYVICDTIAAICAAPVQEKIVHPPIEPPVVPAAHPSTLPPGAIPSAMGPGWVNPSAGGDA